MQFAAYISDTPATLKQSQGHQIYNDNEDPKQGYDHAIFEWSCFIQDKAKVKDLFWMRKYVIFFLEHVWKSKLVVYSWCTWHNQQSYKVSAQLDKNTKCSVKTVWHCCDLEVQSRSLKVVWMGRAQSVLTSRKVWHLLYL